MTLDERAMEIYFAGKVTLKQAYEQAKFERGEACDVGEIFNGLFKGRR